MPDQIGRNPPSSSVIMRVLKSHLAIFHTSWGVPVNPYISRSNWVPTRMTEESACIRTEVSGGISVYILNNGVISVGSRSILNSHCCRALTLGYELHLGHTVTCLRRCGSSRIPRPLLTRIQRPYPPRYPYSVLDFLIDTRTWLADLRHSFTRCMHAAVQ